MPSCKECKGSGGVKCPNCDGKGKIYTGIFRTNTEECKHCHGSGRKKCGVCDGRGSV